MKSLAIAGLTTLLLATATHAANPVVVQPNPVILPSEQPSAALAPAAPGVESKAKASAAKKGKPAKKQAKAIKKAKTHAAKKVAKAKARPRKARG
jgi:hypothetical protein